MGHLGAKSIAGKPVNILRLSIAKSISLSVTDYA